jgi:hypothetical protein
MIKYEAYINQRHYFRQLVLGRLPVSFICKFAPVLA